MEEKVLNIEFCCITKDEINNLKIENDKCRIEYVYQYQKKYISKTTDGYICKKCGKKYPFESVSYNGNRYNVGNISKEKQEAVKIKGNYEPLLKGNKLYVGSKKSILIYDIKGAAQMTLLREIKTKTDFYAQVISLNENLAATISLNNKICIYDLNTEKILWEKKLKFSTNIIFSEDSKHLYYHQNGTIYQHTIENNNETIIWKSDNNDESEIVSIGAFIFNEDRHSVVAIGNRKYSFAVEISSLGIKSYRLPVKWGVKACWFSSLTKTYFISNNHGVYRFNDNFEYMEEIMVPVLEQYSDGGGIFPICKIDDILPDRVMVTEDEKWIVFDYFTSYILVDFVNKRVVQYLKKNSSPIDVIGFYQGKYLVYEIGQKIYYKELNDRI